MDAKSLILRSTLRHYLEFEAYFAQTGEHTLEYGGVTICFLDLQGCLSSISERKRQAVELNVIRDLLQRETAHIMGIKTVTVGQYVDHAMIQMGRRLWNDDDVLIESVAKRLASSEKAYIEKKEGRKLRVVRKHVEPVRAVPVGSP